MAPSIVWRPRGGSSVARSGRPDAKVQINQFILVAAQAKVEAEVRLLAKERFGDGLGVSST